MDEQEKNWRRYQAALSLTQTEESTVWQRFSIFLVTNIILLGTTLWKEAGISRTALPIMGLVICAIWLALSMRGFTYQLYYFRYAQHVEKLLDSQTLVQQAAELGKNNITIVDEGPLRMPWPGRLITGPHAAYVIVYVFMGIYLTLAVYELVGRGK